MGPLNAAALVARLLALPLATAFAACGGGDTTAARPDNVRPVPVLSSINVDAPSSSIVIGGTVQITATPLYQGGRGLAASLSWSSANTGIATVSDSGVVTGVAAGAVTVTVMASAGGTNVSSNITINVMPAWAGAPPPRNVLVNNPARSRFPDIAQKEPSVAVFGSKIVVGWKDESILLGQTVRGIRSSVGYGFSADGGATFTDAGEVGSSHWGADPSVTADRAGNFYFGRIDFVPGSTSLDRIAVFKWLDGEQGFLQSVSAGAVTGSGINDKPTIAADNTGGTFDGSVYASWTFASSNVLKVVLSASRDGGITFSAPAFLSDGTRDQGSFPAVGPRGELYVLWGDGVARQLYVRKSLDGGVTFAPATLVASVSPIGVAATEVAQYCGNVLNGQLGASGSPILAVDRSGGPTSGTLYVVFNSHGADADGADVYLTSSGDGGQTWSIPLRLNDDATTSDQFMPFVVVAPNGAVAVSWYDRRQDPENLLMDVFMRISRDGGASFGPNLKITEVSFPPPQLNTKLGFPPYTCYMSSYNFMAADPTHFYMVWTDNRMVTSSTVDSNIFFAKVPY